MKIVYFGTYQREYPRNKIFIEGLKENGISVVEVNVPITKSKKYKARNFFILNFPLILDYFLASIKLFFKLIKVKEYDLIIVGFPSFFDVFLAKAIAYLHGKKIVVNPLVSVYNTLVEDRKIIKKESLIAKAIFKLEKFGLKLSDKIILDTQAHINYFSRKFKINKRKFAKVFVGADESIFHPVKGWKKNKVFLVGFYGTFIPLHGIEYIIEAAKILRKQENIAFELLGDGQLLPEMKRLSRKLETSNIKFLQPVKQNKLPKIISRFDVCLGVFGRSKKASMVVPNKIYQYIAMKKPVITGVSNGCTEIFNHKKNIFFCKRGNAESLANAIIELKKKENLRKKISTEAHDLFKQKFGKRNIGLTLSKVLREI